MSLAVYRTPLCEPSPWPQEQAWDQTFTRRSLARAGLLGRRWRGPSRSSTSCAASPC